ncbi:MAG TPA: hypothetical protein VLH75_07035 [Longimicrobiales bacterium]|nr:hypothetical protein [Longimicrobiales bacterium]
MSHAPLLDARVWRLLLETDGELAAEARGKGCACGGRLHRARYRRKPRRGVPEELRGEYGWRESLCCEREGCRKRVMPASVRFLGRRVYLAALVVLVSAMTGGVTARRAAAMRELIGVSVRTLQRWRAWWLGSFPRTVVWRGARGLLAPPVDEARLPASLLERFTDPGGDGLVACLGFLAPMTMRGGYAMAV